MKKQFELLAVCLSLAATTFASSANGELKSIINTSYTQMEQDDTSEEKSIEECITGFVKAGDKNDAAALGTYLDANYRVVMNRLFGSEEVQVVDRPTYLEKISSKEWGGDTRTIRLEGILINGNSASARVKLIGEKATVNSLLLLVKDEHGNWKIVSDSPEFS